MTAPASERVPPPIRRVVAFFVAGAVVYAVSLALGRLLFSPIVASGTAYGLSSIVAAAIAAFYLVYLDGFARLDALLR